jgi:hypothetical protein
MTFIIRKEINMALTFIKYNGPEEDRANNNNHSNQMNENNDEYENSRKEF